MFTLSAALLGLAAATSACDGLRPATSVSAVAAATDDGSPTAASAGYAAPPSLTAVTRRAGGIEVRGSAQPGAQVSLAAPDGAAGQAVADARGAWRLILPAAETPRMFALSAESGGRVVRAEGAVVALPAPGAPVLIARPGAAALPAPSRNARPVIAAIDYDAGGAAAVAGSAAPNARVQLSVDGQPSDAVTTDASGRFALAGPRTQPLSAAAHLFVVQTPAGATQASITLKPPADLKAQVYRAVRDAEGWRIDWRLPGGGVQTTLVVEPGGAA